MSTGARRPKIGLAAWITVFGVVLATGFPACDEPIQPVEGQAGNASSGGSGGVGSGGAGGGGQDACQVIAGKTYTSAAHECGLGGRGVPLSCTWQISFSNDGTYEWRYSDLRPSGKYRCVGAEITGAPAYHGTLDFGTGDLTWEGEDYRPQP